MFCLFAFARLYFDSIAEDKQEAGWETGWKLHAAKGNRSGLVAATRTQPPCVYQPSSRESLLFTLRFNWNTLFQLCTEHSTETHRGNLFYWQISVKNSETDKVSPLQWSPFKTNYRAERWVTAAGVLKHESTVSLRTARCVFHCVPLCALQNAHPAPAVVSGSTVGLITSHTERINWSAVLIGGHDTWAAQWIIHFFYMFFLHILDRADLCELFHPEGPAKTSIACLWREKEAFARVSVFG